MSCPESAGKEVDSCLSPRRTELVNDQVVGGLCHTLSLTGFKVITGNIERKNVGVCGAVIHV